MNFADTFSLGISAHNYNKKMMLWAQSWISLPKQVVQGEALRLHVRGLGGRCHAVQAYLRTSVMMTMLLLLLLRLVCIGRWHPKVSIQEWIVDVVEQQTVLAVRVMPSFRLPVLPAAPNWPQVAIRDLNSESPAPSWLKQDVGNAAWLSRIPCIAAMQPHKVRHRKRDRECVCGRFGE